MQSLLARLHQTAGVLERGTEKETCFGTSETRIPPWTTGEGHNQQKKVAYRNAGSRIIPQYSETVAPVTRGQG